MLNVAISVVPKGAMCYNKRVDIGRSSVAFFAKMNVLERKEAHNNE